MRGRAEQRTARVCTTTQNWNRQTFRPVEQKLRDVVVPIVEIEILGRRYALQSDRDPAHVEAVAFHVDEQLRQMASAGVSSVTRDDAVLVALNIASELFLAKEKGDEFVRSMDRRLSSLITLIDHGVALTTGPVAPPSRPLNPD